MLSNLQTNSTIAKYVRMSAPRKTVSAKDMQEEWLEIQAAQLKPALFQPLYERYYEEIFLFIYRRSGDEEITGDICAHVFLKAMNRLNTYTFKGVPFSAWLYRIASNEVAQYYRNLQKNRTVSLEVTSLSHLMDEVDEPFDEVKRADMLKALDALNETDMQLIEMRFFESKSYKEIADIMNITENNAKVKTFRVLNRLKKQLL